MAYTVVSKGKGLPDDSQTIGQQAIPTYFATGDQQAVSSHPFTMIVASESFGTLDLTDDELFLSTDDERIYTGLTITCGNDTNMHLVGFQRLPDGPYFAYLFFVTSKDIAFQAPIKRPSYGNVTVYNFSDATLQFNGILYFITRKKEADSS